MRDKVQRWPPVAHLATMSSGPRAIFALVLRNPSSCFSRKGKNRLLPACQRMASKPRACCSGRPLHGYYKHVWGLGLKWRLLLNAAKLQHGSRKSPSAICCGSSVEKAELSQKSTAWVPPGPTPWYACGGVRQVGRGSTRHGLSLLSRR